MKHEALKTALEAQGMRVEPRPDTGARSYSATFPDRLNVPRVYWRTSTEGGMLGLPRVITSNGHDTHARNIKEVLYLIKT